jgi:hypothetical protein
MYYGIFFENFRVFKDIVTIRYNYGVKCTDRGIFDKPPPLPSPYKGRELS